MGRAGQPAKPPQPVKSTSNALVPRRVVRNGDDEDISRALVSKSGTVKPSTKKALILRNGKHGSAGTGELVLSSDRIPGQEKLQLLAEDLMKRAIRAPFSLQTLMKMADSQMDLHWSEIQNMHDATFFYDDILLEVGAHAKRNAKGDVSQDPTKDPALITHSVASRLHNLYFLTAAWKLVGDLVAELHALSGSDADFKALLKTREDIRDRFLMLYQTVEMLAQAGQSRVQGLSISTAHYGPFFASTVNGEGDQVLFDKAKIRSAHRSFVDAVVLEIILPDSQYPRHVLFECLHEAIEESPIDGKRFPQLLWDAIGDLAVTVRFLDILDGALLAGEREKWAPRDPDIPEAHQAFFEATKLSLTTLQDSAVYEPVLFPLTKAKTATNVESFWKLVDENYKSNTGLGIDELWGLLVQGSSTVDTTQWRMPTLAEKPGESDSEDEAPRPKRPSGTKKASRPKKEPPLLQIANEAFEADSDRPPSLRSMSDSSADSAEYSSGIELPGASDDEDDDDSAYETDFDSDDEDAFRGLEREAMDLLSQHPELADPRQPTKSKKAKTNPFIQLIRQFNGRSFSKGPAIQPKGKSGWSQKFKDAISIDPPVRGPARPAKKPSTQAPKATAPTPAKSDQTRPAGQPKSMKATVEDAPDDEAPKKKKKKKKKPSKSKSKAKAEGEGAEEQEAAAEPVVEAPAPPPPVSPPATPVLTPAAPTTPTKSGKAKPPKSPAKPAPKPAAGAADSTYSLPLPTSQTAQSAHSYLKDNVLPSKSKVKSRPDGDNPSFAPPEKNKWFKGSKDSKDKKPGLFSRFIRGSVSVSKKSSEVIHRFLRSDKNAAKGKIRWDRFVKAMEEMGFTVDPSTAGSSVRFDPPDPDASPITFHKPHPDSTLQNHHLRSFGKRLREKYYWVDDDKMGPLGDLVDDSDID
ncbi:hypothetical protein SISSUDRAFT_1117652 [Sistotremastrum suecicum HHB10207 ss-3]|uniref:Uncharacterized protein n=1 Tax=Sistotremastrum suecicum HHB10207 ss-3 TaxID=1314776 RepID=A0A166GBM7_9AGAM|nr:hypothetical protein SISSUDRAFT_1117652 [Sistotremastrum suecicum HHB10207 ss-3]